MIARSLSLMFTKKCLPEMERNGAREVNPEPKK